MWFCKKDTEKNLCQPFGHSAGHLRQLCLESLENRMAMAVDPLAAIDEVSAPRPNERAVLLADTAFESTDGRILLSPASSSETNALGQLFLTSRLEITDAQGRAVTAVQENERLWVNIYHTYYRDSFTEDFKLIATSMTVVFVDPLFTQVGEVESLDMPAENAWQRRTIPDPRTGIGTLSVIEMLQHRFEILAAPSSEPRGSELHKTLPRLGGYLWIESLPLTIERLELAPPVVVPDNTTVVKPTVTPVVTPTVSAVVAWNH